jgi:hypothetical protein
MELYPPSRYPNIYFPFYHIPYLMYGLFIYYRLSWLYIPVTSFLSISESLQILYQKTFSILKDAFLLRIIFHIGTKI